MQIRGLQLSKTLVYIFAFYPIIILVLACTVGCALHFHYHSGDSDVPSFSIAENDRGTSNQEMGGRNNDGTHLPFTSSNSNGNSS